MASIRHALLVHFRKHLGNVLKWVQSNLRNIDAVCFSWAVVKGGRRGGGVSYWLDVGFRNTDDIQCLCLHTIAQIQEHSDRTEVSDGIRRLQPQALGTAHIKMMAALFWADIPANNLLGTSSHNHRLLLPSIVVLLWCSLHNLVRPTNPT